MFQGLPDNVVALRSDLNNLPVETGYLLGESCLKRVVKLFGIFFSQGVSKR